LIHKLNKNTKGKYEFEIYRHEKEFLSRSFLDYGKKYTLIEDEISWFTAFLINTNEFISKKSLFHD